MNFATLLGIELHRLLRPLTDVAYGNRPMEDLRDLLRGCGWVVTVDLDSQDVIDAIDPLVETVESFLADPLPNDFVEATERMERVATLIDDLRSLGTSFAELDGGALPTTEATTALTEDLLHHLAIRWLQEKAAVLKITDLLDLTARVPVAEIELGWLKRRAGTQRRVQLSNLPALLGDPGGFVLDRLAPEGWISDVHVQVTMLELATVLGPLMSPRGWQPALRSRHSIPDPREVAALLAQPRYELSLPSTPGLPGSVITVDVETAATDGQLPSGTGGPGVAFYPSGSGSLSTRRLGWDLTLSATLDTEGEPIDATPDGITFNSSSSAAFDVLAERDLDLVLGLGRTGLTLGKIEISTAVDVSNDDPPELRTEVVLRESAAGVSTQDFGSAVAMILPFDVEVPFDLGLAWSSISGLTLSGSASLNATIANEISVAGGAFIFRDIVLSFEIDDAAPSLAASLSGEIDFTLTEFAATVEGLGLKADVTFPDGGGNLGQAHLSFGLDLPDSLGLSIDLEAVKGGGFISIDHEIGRYSGAISIKIIEVGITAITVIDTQIPGENDSWSFFASLSLEFPSIPLGFGFTLSGVGGLVAINRSLDTFAIAAALKDGVIDALLFPDDPVADAPLLISMIDDYFPILEGNSVFGPIVEIGWGAPKTLITMRMGVVISIPEGKIALLGSISAILPTPDAPLLSLNMDLIGEVDLAAGTLFMTASLYDSNLLGTIELSGDMGAYLATTGQPYFLMSVGGSHPGFDPPSVVPAVLHDLRRMCAGISIASNVDVDITSYFAVTSNTVQYGAAVELEMSTKILFTTYYARGDFGFDVLIQFDPFAVIADLYASVGVYSGNKELMGVNLSAHLEGPDPWFASGVASFKFFGINVDFNVEVGSKAPNESKPRVPLRDDLIAALEARESWREVPPAGAVASGITFIDLEADPEANEDRIWVRPDHSVAVSQGVVPLDKTIEVVGQGLPEVGEERHDITAASLGALDLDYQTIDDFFAPAQFEALSRKDKLERASFEEMSAGVSFGEAVATTTAHPNTLANSSINDYEEKWWELDAAKAVQFGTNLVAQGLAMGSAATALNRTSPKPTPKFTVEPVQFVAVDAVSGEIATSLAGGEEAGTQNAARAAASATAGAVAVSAASLEAAA